MWRTKKPIRSQRIFRSRSSSVSGQGLLILKYCLSPSLHLQELKQARQTAATEKHCSTLSKTRRRTHDKDLAAGGSAIKKSTPYGVLFFASDRRGSNPRSRPWQGRALPTTPLSHFASPFSKDEGHSIEIFLSCQMFF